MKKGFSQVLKSFFNFNRSFDDSFFEELTDALIEGDIGQSLALKIEDELKKRVKEKKIKDPSELPNELAGLLAENVQEVRFPLEKDKRNVWLVLGVNGVGKTTTAAKMANLLKGENLNSLLLVAADTFRAAAIDQLKYHGEKIGVRVIANQQGGDAAAVVFDAGEALKSNGGGLAIVDTAGRLHNRNDLVRELQKIDRIASSKADEGCYKKIVVLDSTTGQNALRQAEVFKEAIGLDAAILTKYDSTAKGGIAVSIGRELGVPILFVCTGETYADIKPFDKEAYVKEFFED